MSVDVLARLVDKSLIAVVPARQGRTRYRPLETVREYAAEKLAAADGAAQLRGGSIRGFEEVSRYSTPDLGYVVQIERAQARLAGGEHISPIALRVTMIFRREGDTWKLAHRHADPITTARPITTTIEKT